MASRTRDADKVFVVMNERAALLLEAATVVQTESEAGHANNQVGHGPVFQLLGLLNGCGKGHLYDATEAIEKFKPRLVELIAAGAVFPESTEKAEREALREAVQVAVDACDVAEAASIEDRRANLVTLEEMADDPRYAQYKKRDWQLAANELGIQTPHAFKALGGIGPKKKGASWVLAVKALVKLRRGELKKEEKEDGAAEAAKAAHSAAAFEVYKAAHSAVEKYEKVQLEKAVKAGGNALRDRLWARAVARADSNSSRGVKAGTACVLTGGWKKGVAKSCRERTKNMWSHRKYDASEYAKNNNYAGYCEKGREPAGCYKPVNYLEYCASLPVSEDFKFQLDEDGEIV